VEDIQGSLVRCSVGQMTSGHTAFSVCSPPFDELNGGEVIVCVSYLPCMFRSMLCFMLCICFSLVCLSLLKFSCA